METVPHSQEDSKKVWCSIIQLERGLKQHNLTKKMSQSLQLGLSGSPATARSRVFVFMSVLLTLPRKSHSGTIAATSCPCALYRHAIFIVAQTWANATLGCFKDILVVDIGRR